MKSIPSRNIQNIFEMDKQHQFVIKIYRFVEIAMWSLSCTYGSLFAYIKMKKTKNELHKIGITTSRLIFQVALSVALSTFNFLFNSIRGDIILKDSLNNEIYLKHIFEQQGKGNWYCKDQLKIIKKNKIGNDLTILLKCDDGNQYFYCIPNIPKVPPELDDFMGDQDTTSEKKLK